MHWSFPVFLQTWICSQKIDVPETATEILHAGQAAEGPEHPSSQEEQMPAPVASKHLWKHMDVPGSSTHTQGLPRVGALLCSPTLVASTAREPGGAAYSHLHSFHQKIRKCKLKISCINLYNCQLFLQEKTQHFCGEKMF